jgi:hypothetical protein
MHGATIKFIALVSTASHARQLPPVLAPSTSCKLTTRSHSPLGPSCISCGSDTRTATSQPLQCTLPLEFAPAPPLLTPLSLAVCCTSLRVAPTAWPVAGTPSQQPRLQCAQHCNAQSLSLTCVLAKVQCNMPLMRRTSLHGAGGHLSLSICSRFTAPTLALPAPGARHLSCRSVRTPPSYAVTLCLTGSQTPQSKCCQASRG